MDTNRLLDAVCRRHGLTSNRSLARFLEIDRTRITAYRAGRRTLDADACIAVAKALDEPAGYVLATVQAERAKRTTHRREWMKAAKQLRHTAMAVALSVGAGSGLLGHDVQAAATTDRSAQNLYILSNRRDRRRRRRNRQRWLEFADPERRPVVS